MTSRTSTRPTRRTRHRVASAVTALALFVAGCGGSDDSDSSDNGATSQPTDGTDADTGTESPSGTLRMGMATNVQSFDPQLAAVAQEYYLHPLYDTLVRTAPDGAYEPGLAESWEWVDQTTLSLSIRPDVAFSDGEPVDAAAVAANFERGTTMDASPSSAFYANITSVEATDASTVQLELDHPTTSMLDDLSRLPGMMMSPAAFEGDPGTQPIGAGGWTLDNDASNPGEVQVFRANPTYWEPSRIGVETIEMRILETDAAANAMIGGQVDIIELRSEADTETFASGGFQMIDRPNANVWYLQIMDTDGSLLEPMGDERVRQALNLAIDREAFNEGLQFGQGDPSPSFWLEGTPYYDESAADWKYDPDRARELLAEAGYPDGFEITFPSFGAIVPVAESVQQMWAEIGVDVSIDLVEPGTLADVMRSGDTVMNPTIARGFTAESHYKERLAPDSPYDPLGTERGDLAAMAETAYTAESVDAQNEAWRELYAYAVDQGYMIVIGHQIPTAVLAEGVDGAVMRPSDNLPQPYGITVGG